MRVLFDHLMIECNKESKDMMGNMGTISQDHGPMCYKVNTLYCHCLITGEVLCWSKCQPSIVLETNTGPSS